MSELDSKALEAATEAWATAWISAHSNGRFSVRAAITAYLSALPAPATQEVDELRGIKPLAWRCFHCDEVFTEEHEALHHFGRSEDQEPLCQVTTERYREVERQLAEYRNESDAASKTFYALGADHYVKEKAAEEAGYARGIADAKAHPEDIGLEDTARLDWLEMRRVEVTPPDSRWHDFVASPGGGVLTDNYIASDLRAQIDRARAAEKDKG